MRRRAAAASCRGGALVVDVKPRSPYRLPAGRWPDGVARTRDGVYERFLHVDGRPVLLRAWEVPAEGRVSVAAMPAPSAWLGEGDDEPARPEDLERAVASCRHAIAIDDDLTEFHQRFRRHPLVGPLVRRMPWLRARRCAQPWEAFAWAVTEQLIEAKRATVIQRRIVRRWGSELAFGDRIRALRDIPGPEVVAGLAPAELAALDLAPKRALALIKAAREVASGRCDPSRAGDDRRLGAISEIGPWTLQCLALNGRGDLDALPAGDLAYVKLVGHLAGLGRRATVAEVEEYYAPYAPYRGIVGLLTLSGLRRAFRSAPPLHYHPANPEFEAA
jgi:DNA-3-methyladenine glycosylase II